jgi:hypothetical protein
MQRLLILGAFQLFRRMGFPIWSMFADALFSSE